MKLRLVTLHVLRSEKSGAEERYERGKNGPGKEEADGRDIGRAKPAVAEDRALWCERRAPRSRVLTRQCRICADPIDMQTGGAG